MDVAATATTLLSPYEQIRALLYFGENDIFVGFFFTDLKPVLLPDQLVTKVHCNKYIMLPFAPIRSLEV